MSDFSSIQALLEKHAPKPKPRLPAANEVRRLVVKSQIVEGQRAPAHVVQFIHAQYLKHKSVRKAAKSVGMGRTTVRRMFKNNSLEVVQQFRQPVRFWNGRKYTLKSDGSCWRRTRRGEQYMSLHRDMWEAANGPISKGMCVVALDGDNIDIRLPNLKLMTRSDYMKHLTALRIKKAA
jgi:AraC-like DNA-binding protein